jgi:hypothetical protein
MGASVCRVIGRHAAGWGDISEDLRYLEAGGASTGADPAVLRRRKSLASR